jgi:hypothetical protein
MLEDMGPNTTSALCYKTFYDCNVSSLSVYHQQAFGVLSNACGKEQEPPPPRGRALTLLASIRLGWKVERLARNKQFSLLETFVNYVKTLKSLLAYLTKIFL